MTALAWDEVGERRYDTGVDRGVLYLPDGGAVPWNGLTSLTENLGREVKSYYNDGVKYLDHEVIGDFSGTLQAYTYPDELEELIGILPFAPGVFVHDQRSKTFSFSYRTKVGNDVDQDLGYKIHLVYNVLASPSNHQHISLAETITPVLFEWALSGTPPVMYGLRPSCHISLHTRSIDPTLLADIEEIIYGDVDTDPSLPDLVDLLAMVEAS
jgi:hypothetical protein